MSNRHLHAWIGDRYDGRRRKPFAFGYKIQYTDYSMKIEEPGDFLEILTLLNLDNIHNATWNRRAIVSKWILSVVVGFIDWQCFAMKGTKPTQTPTPRHSTCVLKLCVKVYDYILQSHYLTHTVSYSYSYFIGKTHSKRAWLNEREQLIHKT